MKTMKSSCRIRASRAVGITLMRSCQEGVFLQYDIYNCRCSQTLAQPIAIAAEGRPLWPYITLKDDAHWQQNRRRSITVRIANRQSTLLRNRWSHADEPLQENKYKYAKKHIILGILTVVAIATGAMVTAAAIIDIVFLIVTVYIYIYICNY